MAGEAFTTLDTHGVRLREGNTLWESSDDLGWTEVYASHQLERPFRGSSQPRQDPLIIIGTGAHSMVRLRRWLGGKESARTMPPRALFILPPGCKFDVELMNPTETLHIYVRRRVLEGAAAELCRGTGGPIELVPRMGERDPVIETLGRMLHEMLRDRQGSYFAAAAARLLAARLLKEHSSERMRPAPRQGLTPEQLARVHDRIEEEMDSPLTLCDMAATLGLSPVHFARMFKRTTGMPPHRYLIERRVDRARRLLHGDQTLADIAYSCGFSHQEHMTRMFGRAIGSTPLAYRRAVSS